MHFPTDIRRCAYASPLGPMTLAATDRGLAGVWFDGQRHMPDTAAWPQRPDDPVLRRAARALDAYFAGAADAFEGLPLDLGHGTVFQQQVWQALLAIGHGRRSTYAALGQAMGRPAAVRAVGAAVGRNPISVVVPCHRVLGADGSLTGYAGGLPRKAALLQLEAKRAMAQAA